MAHDVRPTLRAGPDGGRVRIRPSDAKQGVLDTERSREDPEPEPPEAFLDSGRAAGLVGELAGRADRNRALPRPRYRPVGRNRLALVN